MRVELNIQRMKLNPRIETVEKRITLKPQEVIDVLNDERVRGCLTQSMKLIFDIPYKAGGIAYAKFPIGDSTLKEVSKIVSYGQLFETHLIQGIDFQWGQYGFIENQKNV